MSTENALVAGSVVAKYMAMAVSEPVQTKQFVGSVVHYISSYNHELLQPPHLPERLLHELLPEIASQAISFNHKVEPRSLPYGEAYVLASITALVEPRKVFEIGTFTGGASLIMAEHAGPDCEIYTLDMPPDNKELQLPGSEADPPEMNNLRIGERFRGTKYESQITQLYGDSAAFDFSPYKGQMDLVLVDGSHSYRYVQNDTRKALEMLSARGTIIWDDCYSRHPDVIRALNEFGESLSIYRIAATRFAMYTRLI